MQPRAIIIKIFLRNNNSFVVLSCDFSPMSQHRFCIFRSIVAILPCRLNFKLECSTFPRGTPKTYQTRIAQIRFGKEVIRTGKLLFNFNSQIRVPYVIQVFYDFFEYSVDSFDIPMFILNYMIRCLPITLFLQDASFKCNSKWRKY